MRVKNNKLNKKNLKSEAESIVASKNVKVFMKLEDPTETYNLFEKCRKRQFIAPIQYRKTVAKSKNL